MKMRDEPPDPAPRLRRGGIGAHFLEVRAAQPHQHRLTAIAIDAKLAVARAAANCRALPSSKKYAFVPSHTASLRTR